MPHSHLRTPSSVSSAPRTARCCLKTASAQLNISVEPNCRLAGREGAQRARDYAVQSNDRATQKGQSHAQRHSHNNKPQRERSAINRLCYDVCDTIATKSLSLLLVILLLIMLFEYYIVFFGGLHRQRCHVYVARLSHQTRTLSGQRSAS